MQNYRTENLQQYWQETFKPKCMLQHLGKSAVSLAGGGNFAGELSIYSSTDKKL